MKDLSSSLYELRRLSINICWSSFVIGAPWKSHLKTHVICTLFPVFIFSFACWVAPNEFPSPETTRGWMCTSFRRNDFWDCLSQQAFLMTSWLTRENDLRERIPHTWPSSHENYFQSILGSVSYCVVILRTPPYWSVRVGSCTFKLGG